MAGEVRPQQHTWANQLVGDQDWCQPLLMPPIAMSTGDLDSVAGCSPTGHAGNLMGQTEQLNGLD